MTTPEHTLVGIHAAIAVGAHQRFGWALVALAGIASNFPDWDGLPMLFDMSKFESGHRVWGHNIFWIFISSVMVAALQHHYGFVESCAERLKTRLPEDLAIERPTLALSWTSVFFVCFAVQTVHLPCDMVVSGGYGLSDWHIRPFWPISDVGYVYPMIPWGDIGPTLILMGGAIMLAKYPRRLPLQSLVTLAVLCAYLVIRDWSRSSS